MLIYEIKHIPDLTLSKYQVFADSGVDGMLEAQTQFIRQLHRVALLGNVSIHFVFDYDPDRSAGNKLRIRLVFKNVTLNGYKDKLRKIVHASSISSYFSFKEVASDDGTQITFSHMAVMHKKERFLQTVINSEERYFYVVPNWEISENARLYGLLKMMQSFDERCIYRVDLYTEEGIADRIHRNFEKPLSYLRNITSQERGISELSRISREKRDPNADETLKQYEEWLKAVDTSPAFICRICALTNDGHYGQLILDSAISECLETGDGCITTYKGTFTSDALMGELPIYCAEDTPKSMQRWATTFTVEEIAAFSRLPVLYDGESIELPKETTAKHESEGMVIGTDTNDYNVMIPQELLPKHMFVCGVPGSGKTNTMLHLAKSLWNTEINNNGKVRKSQIPFLVLEPAKREYRELALPAFDIPELIIFSPSACTNFPIKLNPFEFPLGLTLSEHIGNLCKVFEGAFPIAPPAPFILDRAIQKVYENNDWKFLLCHIWTDPAIYNQA